MAKRKREIDVYSEMDDQIEVACIADGQDWVFITNSSYKSDHKGWPINNLNEVAVEGPVILFHRKSATWGGKKSRDYYSPVLNSPTWLEVCVHANRMVKCVRDVHHIFVEGLRKRGTKDGFPTYEFCMGS